jgi:hypothetical protein
MKSEKQREVKGVIVLCGENYLPVITLNFVAKVLFITN